MKHHSEHFDRLSKRPDILELAAALVNGDLVLMAVVGQARARGPYRQDNADFNLAPPDSFTCWIALDASNEENSCVCYCRGSHRAPLWPHIASGVSGNSMRTDGGGRGDSRARRRDDPSLHDAASKRTQREQSRTAGTVAPSSKARICGVDRAGAADYAAVRAAAQASANATP